MKNKKGIEIYSNPEADELSKHYGIDLSEELSKILSEQILKSMGIYGRNIRRMDSINKIFKSSE